MLPPFKTHSKEYLENFVNKIKKDNVLDLPRMHKWKYLSIDNSDNSIFVYSKTR